MRIMLVVAFLAALCLDCLPAQAAVVSKVTEDGCELRLPLDVYSVLRNRNFAHAARVSELSAWDEILCAGRQTAGVTRLKHLLRAVAGLETASEYYYYAGSRSHGLEIHHEAWRMANAVARNPLLSDAQKEELRVDYEDLRTYPGAIPAMTERP